MTLDELNVMPIGTILQYRYDTHYNNTICRLDAKSSDGKIRVEILEAGWKGLWVWGSGKSIGYFIERDLHKFHVSDGSFLEDTLVIRKIKTLDKKFKEKTLHKVKVDKLPLGA